MGVSAGEGGGDQTNPPFENLWRRHFNGEERAQIEILHRTGEGPTGIARLIGRSKSTMSVELRRLGPE